MPDTSITALEIIITSLEQSGLPRTRKKTTSDPRIEPSILGLVKLRIAQIHQCEECIHAQTRKLKRNGETQERLHRLKDWREVPFFTDREEAALNLAEALTENWIDRVPLQIFKNTHLYFQP